MTAPTALLRSSEASSQATSIPISAQQEEEVLLDFPTTNPPDIIMTELSGGMDEEGRPVFGQEQNIKGISCRIETRKIPIPPHRMAPLKTCWSQIYPPLVQNLKLQVRMKNRAVELRTSKLTSDGALQKGEDFVKAYVQALGQFEDFVTGRSFKGHTICPTLHFMLIITIANDTVQFYFRFRCV